MKRLLLALLSGLLLAGCFPPLEWTWLLWVWPWPLWAVLWSDAPTTGWRGFGFGYVCGLAFYLTTISWIIEVHWAGWLALSLYLSLYPAGWAMLVVKLAGRPTLAHAALAAAWWGGLEWARGVLLTGFGWNQLGIALAPCSWLIQPAEWLGSAGLSVPLMFVSSAFVIAWRTRQWRGPLLAGSLTLAVWCGLGAWLGQRAAAVPTQPLDVVLVQPNVPQQEKWELAELESIAGTLTDPERESLNQRVLARYDQLYLTTSEALSQGRAQLMVWPESCLHYPFHEPFHRSFLERVAQLGSFALVFGCDVLDGGAYNCCIAQRSDGEHEIYRKVHRVPFGEYVPLRHELPWLADMLKDLLPSDFDAGTSTDPLDASLEGVSIIPTVCFEDVVPRQVRRFARPKPQLIINVANDGWFNNTAQQEQHFWNSRLRSVELRRPLVRSANTGVSFALDSSGKLLALAPKYQPAIVRTTIPIPQNLTTTFYARYGDVLTVSLAVFALVFSIVIKRFVSRSKNGVKPPSSSLPNS